MSGWIKLEKALRDDPRVLRMASRLRNADVTMGDKSRAVVIGALAQLWCYADSHVREDDTLDLGPDELDELVGVPGFARLLPADWIEVIDETTVKLPNFHEHNGTQSRKKALNQKRQERHRMARRYASVTESSTSELPDQTKTKTKTKEKITTAAARPAVEFPRGTDEPESIPPEILDFKIAYPKRAGSQPWRRAVKAAKARRKEGHDWAEMIAGAKRYALYVAASGKEGTEYVMQAATFLGPDKHFTTPWSLPLQPAAKPAPLSALDRVRQATGVDFRNPPPQLREIEHG